MTVRELIDELGKYPKDMKVAVDCWEDQELAGKVSLHIKENCPYPKGDNVWDMHDIPDDELILFIRG